MKKFAHFIMYIFPTALVVFLFSFASIYILLGMWSYPSSNKYFDLILFISSALGATIAFIATKSRFQRRWVYGSILILLFLFSVSEAQWGHHLAETKAHQSIKDSAHH